MIISEKYKVIFLANPKTGSISVQRLLVDNDESAVENVVNVNGNPVKVGGHITASELKTLMGDKYDDYQVFSFIRDPLSKLVSSYFFYKNGQPIMKGNTKPWPARFRMFLAKSLPFSIWSLIYPYKDNKRHLVDESGKVIVNHIGVLERINSDLPEMFKEMNVDIDVSKMVHRNKSSHSSDNSSYIVNSLHNWLLRRKLKQDQDFYDSIYNRENK